MVEFIRKHMLGDRSQSHFGPQPAAEHLSDDRLDATRDFATEASLLAALDGTSAILVNLWALDGAPVAAESRSKHHRTA